MIKRVLRQLRKQSKVSRDNVAFIAAGLLTGMVAMVWMYHAPSRLMSQTDNLLSDSKTESGFWQSFSDFGSQAAAVKDSLQETPESVETALDDRITTTTTTSEQFFYNAATTTQKNTVETDSSDTGFLEAERETSATPSQPIRIIAVNSTTTVSGTTSESW